MNGVINVRHAATLGSNSVLAWRVLMDGPYGVGWGLAVRAGRGGWRYEACGAWTCVGLTARLRDASQFYASPAGEEGYDRFTNAWTTSTDADCANDVFNVSETDVFSSKPFINAAFAYDCMIALAAAMHSAGENASGAKVFEAFTNVSFDGATGEVAFDPNGERLSSTVRYAVDVWRASGSELTAIRVGSFTTKSGYTTQSSKRLFHLAQGHLRLG